MMEDERSIFTSASLPIVTAVLPTGIFIADTVTRVDIAVPVLYVAAGCATLTILSYAITRNTGPANDVRALVQQHARGRQLGFLGQLRVNVLELNLDLDAHPIR